MLGLQNNITQGISCKITPHFFNKSAQKHKHNNVEILCKVQLIKIIFISVFNKLLNKLNNLTHLFSTVCRKIQTARKELCSGGWRHYLLQIQHTQSAEEKMSSLKSLNQLGWTVESRIIVVLQS